MARYDVPEDAVIPILLLLPVMSLMRFKCICKSWCALIESPAFIAGHLNSNCNNNGNGTLLVKRRPYVEDNHEFFLLSDETFEVSANLHAPSSSLNCFNHLRILGSCNGIICLYDQHRGQSEGDGNLLALWNPATRGFKTLPESRAVHWPGLKSNECQVGFGFDHKTNDYRVVRIVYEHRCDSQCNNHPQVELYSLNTDSWRLIDAVMPTTSLWRYHCPGTYQNGIYSWWARTEMLVSFDMSNEVFLGTPLPGSCPYALYHGYHKIFVVLNESIGFFYYPSTTADYMEEWFEIWMLNDYGEKGSWTKLYRIEPFSAFGFSFPYGFSKNGELFLDETLIETTEGSLRLLKDRLVLFDPVTQEIKNLHVDSVPSSLQLIVYKESLVSIKGGNGPFLN